MRARTIAGSVAFVGAAAGLLAVGEEWDSVPGGLFVVWLAVHFAYGAVVASFRALSTGLLVPVALVPAALVPAASDTGEELWVQAVFAELFYGIPFVFIGVVARRLWQARRPPELPQGAGREETSR